MRFWHLFKNDMLIRKSIISCTNYIVSDLTVTAMEESREYSTLHKCTEQLEIALDGNRGMLSP